MPRCKIHPLISDTSGKNRVDRIRSARHQAQAQQLVNRLDSINHDFAEDDLEPDLEPGLELPNGRVPPAAASPPARVSRQESQASIWENALRAEDIDGAQSPAKNGATAEDESAAEEPPNPIAAFFGWISPRS